MHNNTLYTMSILQIPYLKSSFSKRFFMLFITAAKEFSGCLSEINVFADCEVSMVF